MEWKMVFAFSKKQFPQPLNFYFIIVILFKKSNLVSRKTAAFQFLLIGIMSEKQSMIAAPGDSDTSYLGGHHGF